MNKTQLVAQVQQQLGASTSKAMAERATDAVLAAEKRG
jgi:nucleoid DNA-binding protein